MFKIKQIPEDFIVKEKTIFEKGLIGHYSYFKLFKKNHTTSKAVQLIAERLKIPIKRIGYAGNKDKIAITEQTISIKDIQPEKVLKLNLKDINLEYLGQGKNPISLGNLEGNYFIIAIRNLLQEEIDNIPKKTSVPNYFDEQRFSKNNVKIGKSILKRDFKTACILIDQESIKRHIEIYKNDFIGALRTVNIKILKLYIHAYQSFLWNETINNIIKKGKKVKYSLGYFIFPKGKIKNKQIPIIGFGTEIKDKSIKKIVENILKKEKIKFRDFIIKELPELSSEGFERDMAVSVNINIKLIEKEKNNRFKSILEFFLPKGSYATIVIRALFA